MFAETLRKFVMLGFCILVLCCLAILFIFGNTVASATPVRGGIISRDGIQQIEAATVVVLVEYGDETENRYVYGTGFIVAPGYVVTNAHLFPHKAISRIHIFNQMLPSTPAELVATKYTLNNSLDEGSPVEMMQVLTRALIDATYLGDLEVKLCNSPRQDDLALLRFLNPPAKISGLRFSLETNVGDEVLLCGFPGVIVDLERKGNENYKTVKPRRDTSPTFTNGIVSALLDSAPSQIITTAYSSGGNSGGPLLDIDGNVVGVYTWKLFDKDSAKLSCAISAIEVVDFLTQNGVEAKVAKHSAPKTLVSQADLNETPKEKLQEKLLELAGNGHINCRALIGFLYYLGELGFEHDIHAAVAHLEYALEMIEMTEGNDSIKWIIQSGLAIIHLTHPAFFPPMRVRATKLLKDANNSHYLDEETLKNDTSSALLAFESGLFYQGDATGVPYDPVRSYALAVAAAAGNSAMGKALLGFHYLYGDSGMIVIDRENALEYAYISIDEGSHLGVALLAHIYYFQAIENNDMVRLSLAEELAKSVDGKGVTIPWVSGLLLAANRWRKGQGFDLDEPDFTQAVHAVANGDRFAFLLLGEYYYDKVIQRPELAGDYGIAALGMLRLAASRGMNTGQKIEQDLIEILYPIKGDNLFFECRTFQENILHLIRTHQPLDRMLPPYLTSP